MAIVSSGRRERPLRRSKKVALCLVLVSKVKSCSLGANAVVQNRPRRAALGLPGGGVPRQTFLRQAGRKVNRKRTPCSHDSLFLDRQREKGTVCACRPFPRPTERKKHTLFLRQAEQKHTSFFFDRQSRKDARFFFDRQGGKEVLSLKMPFSLCWSRKR